MMKHSHLKVIIINFILQLSLIFLVTLQLVRTRKTNEDSKIENNSTSRNLFTLNLFANSTAKCLDGSPYGVYYSAGYEEGQKKILLNFWGGGWCAGRDRDAFLSDCLERSNSSLGSSDFWPKEMEKNGTFLGGDPKKNINFYNWHRFDVPYCDGSGHQGLVNDPINVQGKSLYFRGYTNVMTMLNFVFSKVNPKDIDTIAVTGCSAGGLATFTWTQSIADYVRVHNKHVKVFGFPDSGFFVDHINLGTQDKDYKLKQKVLYEVVNKEVEPVSKDCFKDNQDAPFNCLLAENLFKYIDVPFLMLQPGYDSWQLMHILGENCVENNTLSDCDISLKAYAHEYKHFQNELIKEQLKKKNNLSVWSPACLIHCYWEDDINSSDWEVPQNSGNSISYIVKEYLRTNGEYQIKLMDEGDWPVNAKCANVKKDL